MNRAERRRQARQQEKARLPLNPNLSLTKIAGMTGQEAAVSQSYLQAKEKETTEIITDAVIREAQEKLSRAEDYIAIINILVSLYAIKMTWGFTKANGRFLNNYNAARSYVDRVGAAKAYEQVKREMDIEIEFEDLTNYNIYEELGFNRKENETCCRK